MSQYVSRSLAYRRKSDRQHRIATRIAIGVFVLMLALASGFTSYMFLAFTAKIAASTHDAENTIGMIGIWCGILSFASLLSLPLIAVGLHETK